MAVNVLGYPLEFDAVLNTEGLSQGSDAIEAEVNRLIQAYQKAAAAGEGIGAGFEQGSEQAKLFAALMVHVSEQTGEAFDVKNVQKYAQAIAIADETLKPLMATLAQNVGADKIKALGDQLEKVDDDGKALIITLKFIKDNIGSLNLNPEQTQAFAAAVGQIETAFGGVSAQAEQVQTKTISATARLRQIKNELENTDRNNPLFDKDLEEAEQLENKIKNVNKLTELAGENTSGLEVVKEGVRGLIGAFEAYNGILGLVSDSDEQMEKTIKNVVSAMGILNGIEEVAAILDKRSAVNVFLLEQYRKLTAVATEEQAVATEVLVAAQETEVVATEAATVAQEELNVAMAANPAAILLLALSAIVIALQAYASSQKDATEEQTKANEAYAEAAEALNKLVELQKGAYEERAREAENAVSLAEAQGQSEQAILKLKQDALQAQRQANIYALASLGYDKQEFGLMKAKLEDLLEEQHAMLNLKGIQGELTKEQEKQLANIEAQMKALNAQVEPLEKLLSANQSLDGQLEANRAESEKKAYDASLRSAAAAADARLILSKKNTQEELNDQIEAIKKRTAVELDNANLTRGERAKIFAQEQKDIENANRTYKILQLTNTKDIIEAQLNSIRIGSAEELQLRIATVENAAAIQLAAEGVTSERRIAIQAEANNRITILMKQFALANSEAIIQTTIAGIYTQLSEVQKGSEEELDLKKDLIDQQAALDILAAQDRIKNETLLAAKILQINAEANAKKKKEDDDYIDHIIQNRIKVIDKQNELQNSNLDVTINSPFSSDSTKYAASRQKLVNDAIALEKELSIVTEAILSGNGDINKLLAQRADLLAKLQGVLNSTTTLDQNENVRQLKQVASGLGSISGSLKGLSTAFQNVNSDVAHLITGLSTITDLASKAISTATAFATHDVAGGISGVIGIVSSIASLFGSDKPQYTIDQINQMKNQVLIGEIEITRQYEQRLLDQAKLNKLRIDGIREETRLLEQQAQTTQQQFDSLLAQIQKEKGQKVVDILGSGSYAISTVKEFSLAGLSYDQLNDLFLKGQLSDKAKQLFEELQKLQEAGADITQQLADAKDQLDQTFTGTTADDITDSIIDGFKNGLHSAEDFADTFQDLMKNAILNALKYQVLQQPLQDFYNQFALDAESDSVLTDSEIDQLKENFNAIIANAGQKFDELKAITNLDFSSGSTNSLSGAIKGITEQQAELLAGQFGGLRVTVIDQLRIATQGLSVLQEISANTAYLIEVRAILKRLELNGITVK